MPYRRIVTLAFPAVAGLFLLAACSNSPSASSSTPTPKPQSAAPAAKATPKPTPAATPKSTPKTSAPSASNSVTFAVWGNDGGNGTGVTYSSDTTNDDANAEIAGGTASQPAWTSHLDFSSNAEYYAVSAQLQGSGTLGCSVTIVDDGKTYTKQGSASGSYEICSAQLSSGLFGGWS